MLGCLSSCGQLEPHKRGSGRGEGENAPVLWTEQFSVPVINLLPPNILPCPLPEIREDRDSVKMRALGDRSSDEIRCLCLYFAKRRDAHFKSLRASAGSDSAVKTRAVGLEGSVQISRFALCILTVTELSEEQPVLLVCVPTVAPQAGSTRREQQSMKL